MKMKLVAMFLMATLVLPVFAEIVVGKVDMQKIITTIGEGKRVRDRIKKDFDAKQAEIKQEEDKIKAAQENFQKQALVMNDKAKTKKQLELQKMVMGIQEKTMGYQREIQRMEQEQMTPVLDKLKSIIDSVSKDEDVDLTIEAGSTPIILYSKVEKELTDQVIKAYDKKYPIK